MSHSRLFLILFLFSPFMFSCEKNGGEDDAIIAIEQTSYSVGSEAKTIQVSFVTNYNWTIESNESWCKATPNSGTISDNNHAEFRISIDANTTYDKRSCQLLVKAGKKSVPISIEQDCIYGINVSQQQITIESNAQSIEIKVESNVHYSVYSNKNWIQVSSTKSLEPSTLNVSVLANDSFQDRSGTINLSSNEKGLSKQITITQKAPKLLSDAANCYMVKPKSSLSFKAVKGNRNIALENVKDAKVIWESFGTDVVPQKNDIVSKISFSDGSISIETEKEGNALVAVTDESGTILWSWHIWVTSYDPNTDYDTYNNAGIMMNRNLGALSATPGNPLANGLFYQWGRKDPFLAGSSISEAIRMASTYEWPHSEPRTPGVNMVDYATKNPTTFITSVYEAGKSGLWTNDIDDSLWDEQKTMYDPCPPGWRVPGTDVNRSSSFYYLAGFRKNVNIGTEYEDRTNCGFLLTSKYVTPDSWYPCTGHITYQGIFEWVGDYGSIWGFGQSAGVWAWDLIFRIGSGRMCLASDAPRANGKSVRCCKE